MAVSYGKLSEGAQVLFHAVTSHMVTHKEPYHMQLIRRSGNIFELMTPKYFIELENSGFVKVVREPFSAYLMPTKAGLNELVRDGINQMEQETRFNQTER